MKISIFTSTFNRKEKLLRLISSIQNQNYENWELLIVDDGSTDGTDIALSKIVSEKIFYTKINKNEGHPVAIYNSNLLKKINGDIVIFAGSDDVFNEDAFKFIVNAYKKEEDNVWKIGFLFLNEGSNESFHDLHRKIKKLKFLSNEIMSDQYVQSDYLFTYRKIFWDRFLEFYQEPRDFFRSFYDVAMNYSYVEKINKEIILIAGWGEDNVTKGTNSDTYFKWAVYTRKYLFDEYKDNMAKNFYRYTLNSLIRNLLSSKGRRIESIKYISIFFKDIFFIILDISASLILFFLPHNALNSIKKILFRLRQKR